MAADDQHGLECACGATFETSDKLQDHVQQQKWQPDPEQGDTRHPTDDELEDLIQWYMDTYGQDRSEAVQNINQSYVTVLENYATGCPGYAGRLLIQIAYAGPSMHQVFRWDNDQNLVYCKQSDDLRHNQPAR